VLTGASHFGHRGNDGVMVELSWERPDREEFRVEVEDGHAGACFVLHPTTGRDAIPLCDESGLTGRPDKQRYGAFMEQSGRKSAQIAANGRAGESP
jgi:hypothetical protein